MKHDLDMFSWDSPHHSHYFSPPETVHILQKEFLKNKYKYFQDWFTVADSLQTPFNNPTPTLFFSVNLVFLPTGYSVFVRHPDNFTILQKLCPFFVFQSIARMNK